MYAITGITGQVGGVVARALLAAGQSVRAVIRNSAKGQVWADKGCDVAVADMSDATALAAAFAGTDGVFVLLPPVFDPAPDFAESRAAIAAIRTAIVTARPGRIVCLSTIGAQATQANLLTQLGLLEQALSDVAAPVTVLRPAWFMENFAWDVAAARDDGVFRSFLQPLDRPFPMIATADVGRVAADLLQNTWQGRRIIELEAAHRITPGDVAATFARILERPVRAEAVPRADWEALFRAQGMRNPSPRMRMIDGFNDGWIDFERGPACAIKGAVTLETVLRAMV